MNSRLNNILCVPVLLILIKYGYEHPLFEEALRRPDLLPTVLGKGLIACFCCFIGVLIIETIGKGVLAPFNKESSADLPPFAVGLLWITIGSVLLLSFGRLNALTAVFLALPILLIFTQPKRFFEDSLFFGLHWSSWLSILIFGAIAGAYALAPSATYDDHVYHLQAIQDFQTTGSLWSPSHQANIFRPMGHAAFMTWLKILAGAPLAGLANVLFMLSAGLLISRKNGLLGTIGILAWVSNPELMFLAGSSYAEPFQCLVLLLIFIILVPDNAMPIPEGKAMTFFIGGLLAGLLPSIKYTGILLLPITLILVHPHFSSGTLARKSFFPMILGCLLSCLVAAFPFYLRNLVMTGNPVYPHASQLFTGPSTVQSLPFQDLPPDSKDLIDFSYQDFTDRFGMGHDPLNFLLAPYNVTIHGHFHNEKYLLKFFDGQLSPFFLFFWIILLFQLFQRLQKPFMNNLATEITEKSNSERPGECLTEAIGNKYKQKSQSHREMILPLFACAIWILAGWLLGSHQIRFLMPLAVFAAWAIPGLLAEVPQKYLYFWVCLGIISTCWTVSYGINRVDRVAPIVGERITEADYFASLFPFSRCFDWANQRLSDSEKILVLFEERTFLLKKKHLWTGLLPHYFINFLYRAASAQIAEGLLKKHGITHVFIPRYGTNVFSKVDDPTFQAIQIEFFKKRLKPVFSDNQCELLTWTNP